MRTRLHVFVVFAAFALHTLVATGQVGLTEPAGAPGDGPITVFYPSSSTAAPLRRGPFNPHLAKEGAVQRGNGRLIVISHGSGASPWVQTVLAQHLVPRFHSAAVIAQCKTCESIAKLPHAGHGALLAPLPPDTEGRIGHLLP